jgi:hypothetical protein
VLVSPGKVFPEFVVGVADEHQFLFFFRSHPALYDHLYIVLRFHPRHQQGVIVRLQTPVPRHHWVITFREGDREYPRKGTNMNTVPLFVLMTRPMPWCCPIRRRRSRWR